MNMHMQIVIDPRLVLILAGEAGADPRSVRRRLSGERLRPMTEARVDAALIAHGVSIPSTPPAKHRAA